MRWTGLISNFPGTSAGRPSIASCCFSLKVSFVCFNPSFFRGRGLGNIYWWWKSLLANIQRRSWKNSFASHVYLFKRWHAHCSLIFFNIFVNVFSFGAFFVPNIRPGFCTKSLISWKHAFCKKNGFYLQCHLKLWRIMVKPFKQSWTKHLYVCARNDTLGHVVVVNWKSKLCLCSIICANLVNSGAYNT